MSKFKVGDIVSPYDGSFSVGADNKGFAHKCGIEMEDRKFKVVDTGLRVTPMGYDRKFHAGDTRSDGTPAYPDMLIQALDNGEYVFVISDFVKEIPQPVPFMEAAEANENNKTVECKIHGCVNVYNPTLASGMIDQNGCAVSANEILHGEWYIK